MIDDQKVAKVLDILKHMNEDYANTKDVVALVESLLQKMLDIKTSLESTNQGTAGELQKQIDVLGGSLNTLKAAVESDSQEDKNQQEQLKNALQDISDRLQAIKIPEIPEIPDIVPLQTDIGFIYSELKKCLRETDKAEAIRDKLESLKDEERLDASAIKNLPEMVETTAKTFAPVNHPLWALMDVYIPGIAVDQSIKWDGTKWVAYTPSGAGSVAWGGITGTLSAQNDLQTALDAKQPNISLTTSGTSGAATFIGNTLNIPQYTGGSGAAGITRSVSSISSNTAAGVTSLTDYVYLSTATLTLTLPTAVGNTNQYTAKSVSGTTTVATTSAQTINGSATVTISAGSSLTFISDNANWHVI